MVMEFVRFLQISSTLLRIGCRLGLSRRQTPTLSDILREGCERQEREAVDAAAAFDDLSSWNVWLTILSAAFCLPLTAEQLQIFSSISGGRLPPQQAVRELWVVAGRKSGKSRIAALVSIYLALFVKHKVAPGERPMVLCIAGSVDQTRTVFGFRQGFPRSLTNIAPRGHRHRTPRNQIAERRHHRRAQQLF
jgi:hypothetical protein